MGTIALPILAIEQPVPALPAADIETAVRFARNEKAPATRAAYRSDFAAFRVWCLAKGVDALPASPESVAAYLAREATKGAAASPSHGAAPRYATPTASPILSHPPVRNASVPR